MGFLVKWCAWIKGILESARFSILVNGSPTFEFQCSIGIRQEDPLTPFLFIIVMEALSCMTEKAKGVGTVVGIQTPLHGPMVSHLFYADDAILIGEQFKDNISNVIRILWVFHICSGLKITIFKSNLYAIRVGNSELKTMADLIGCQVDEVPFKYLGLWVGANMNRVANWKPMYDIFEARLSKWNASTLSIGGRIFFNSCASYQGLGS
ncbi:uncharacterized protein LOC110933188 [Helianthus annuus]|uniref:uncharacterized protein LOC110933188 n=1 Tax=Helianthus annuus TaxID=4232 RepID=UPI000B9093A8|nr:uncharacterized protein LOC110933188 [Helianthus annuus]